MQEGFGPINHGDKSNEIEHRKLQMLRGSSSFRL